MKPNQKQAQIKALKSVTEQAPTPFQLVGGAVKGMAQLASRLVDKALAPSMRVSKLHDEKMRKMSADPGKAY